MVTEDYVDFEAAKLLKEKGFDARCPMIYTADGKLIYTGVKHHNMYAVTNKYLEYYTDIIAPSQTMAMKWLREVHRIVITTGYANICGLGFTYIASVIKINDNSEIDDVDGPNFCLYKKSYEEACESAIKYCLENLI